MKKVCLIVMCFVCVLHGFSQSGDQYNWYNPLSAPFPVISGRGWHSDLKQPFDRLPAKAEKTTRKAVWDLSHNTAGEYISFTSNAPTIIIRYKVTDRLEMNHMPATGVSGVDLYAVDQQGTWHWAKGNYRFSDTIEYRFSNINFSAAIKEFRLYLPLYNTPAWLQIGVPDASDFSFLKIDDNKPLVLYGTSIMQGACASRPGLAWTNILGRKLNFPVINLGFSGNGRLETELIDLVKEKDAALFVLDCQPNLHDRKTYSEKEIETRIRRSVKALKQAYPATPVLLVEHCCGTDKVSLDTAMTNKYKWTSGILNKTYTALKKEGVSNIHLLTAAEIGFDAESTVDGTHPTDIGMLKYANAYEKKIKQIFKLK